MLQDAIDGVLGRMTLKDLLRNESDMRAWTPAVVKLPMFPAGSNRS